MMRVLIDSRESWCDTGIRLAAGRSYRLSARGTWRDASIVTDAAGYASRNLFQRATERLRRLPDAPWFALIGAVDRRPETQFVIGTDCLFTALRDGELTCFANDLRFFDFNNDGTVTLAVEEQVPAPVGT